MLLFCHQHNYATTSPASVSCTHSKPLTPRCWTRSQSGCSSELQTSICAPHLSGVSPFLKKNLTQMCQMASSLGPPAQAMKVCLTFVFFGMLCQSNIAPSSSATFDPSRHACHSDVLPSPLGLLPVVRWTKTGGQLTCHSHSKSTGSSS